MILVLDCNGWQLSCDLAAGLLLLVTRLATMATIYWREFHQQKCDYWQLDCD